MIRFFVSFLAAGVIWAVSGVVLAFLSPSFSLALEECGRISPIEEWFLIGLMFTEAYGAIRLVDHLWPRKRPGRI
jgi:hypothetical protein